MLAFFMGTRERRLFGAYEPPRQDNAAGRTVVVCPAWGLEYLNSHRSLRRLSAMLSRSGHHVLRFDWFGTGDSGGDDLDATVDGWVGDVRTAIDEAKAITGANQVYLVGLRLGAAIMSIAVAQRTDVGGVVLWDPVIDGATYLAELNEFEMAAQEQRPTARPSRFDPAYDEVLGHRMSNELRRQIEDIDVAASLKAARFEVLLVTSADQEAYRRFADRLADHDVRRTVTVMSTPKAWIEDLESMAGAIPLPLLGTIDDWLGSSKP